MRKKFVLSGYFGFKNFGDEAILTVLVNKLNPSENSITVISSNPDYTKNKHLNTHSIYTFDIKTILKEISKTDYLISGGGSLLQDATSLKSLLYYLFIIFTGLFFRKKVIIFAQGIGPIKSKFGRFITKSILKHCTYLSVRDSKSLDLLNSWGIKADLVCDPVFETKIDYQDKEERVAIQLRNFKTMNKDFIDRLAQKISKEFQDKAIDIYSFQDSIDLEICKEFEKSLKLLNPNIQTQIYNNLSDEEVISRISKSKYLIAMRFHAIIVGLLASVKTLAINYDTKVEKLAKEFNIPIIELNKDFGNQFEDLKNQNTQDIESLTKSKSFNWDGFESTIC